MVIIQALYEPSSASTLNTLKPLKNTAIYHTDPFQIRGKASISNSPRGSEYPNSKVSGPQIHTLKGFWTLKPYYLGTWTLKVLHDLPFAHRRENDLLSPRV